MAQTVSLPTVQQVIARALAAGIHDRGRIERAAQLVVLGAVERIEAAIYTVRSQFQPGTVYTVTSAGCSCADAARAPAQRCKHDDSVRTLLSAERDEARQSKQASRARVTADSMAPAYARAYGRAA